MYAFNLKKPIAIGADHAGFDCKEDLVSFIEAKGLKYKDFGTFSRDSVDYPDFAHPVASAVETGEYAFGILLCGSANGVAITAKPLMGPVPTANRMTDTIKVVTWASIMVMKARS